MRTNASRAPSRDRLLVVDAPGGPLPHFYAARLLEEFDVHVLALTVGRDDAVRRRLLAFESAQSLSYVDDPLQVQAAVLELATRVGAMGVTAFSERVVHSAQRAALLAGLPANSTETLDALQDKVAQRRRLHDAGLHVPRQEVIGPDTDVARLAADFTFPAVLKPAIGMGSIGTSRIDCGEQLERAVRDTRTLVSRDPRIAHLHPDLILEGEIVGDPRTTRGHTRGDYVSVESLTSAGVTQVLAVQDKMPLSQPFRENGHLMPSVRDAGELAAITSCAVAALEALGVQFGVTHTEIKLTVDGPRIIEVNGRPGGGVCEMLRLAAGYELALHQSRACIDTDYRSPTPRFSGFAAYLTPQPPVGRWIVRSAASALDIARQEGVVDVAQIASTGSELDSKDGTGSNTLRVLARADSQEKLAALGLRLAGSEFVELESRESEGVAS